jgi:hypothetical protein
MDAAPITADETRHLDAMMPALDRLLREATGRDRERQGPVEVHLSTHDIPAVTALSPAMRAELVRRYHAIGWSRVEIVEAPGLLGVRLSHDPQERGGA